MLGAPQQSQRIVSSPHTSPSLLSPALCLGTGRVTLSSLRGDYVHTVVHVTRDLVPVVFAAGWNVPFNDDLDLGIADLTLSQLQRIANKMDLVQDIQRNRPSSTGDWVRTVSTRFLTLEDLFKVGPPLLILPVPLKLIHPDLTS